MLDFSLSDDQQTIGEVFRRFFRAESPPEVVRDAEPLGFSLDLWQRLAAFDAPTIRGDGNASSSASMSDLVVIAEELGATLAPVPLIEHWVASSLLLRLGASHPVAQVCTLALRPSVDDLWQLVPAGAVANEVVGVDGNDTVVVSEEPPMRGPVNHGSAPLADRSTTSGERRVLGPSELLGPAVDEWRVLTAAALTGMAATALVLGVDYVKERQQFGRPIGSYQAIQHGLADFPAAIDGARFLTHKAARSLDSGLIGGAGEIDMERGTITEFAPLASMAFLQAADAAVMCTDRILHYHGGYGFAEEYDIQLFFRRARGWTNVAGPLSAERGRLANLLWPAVPASPSFPSPVEGLH